MSQINRLCALRVLGGLAVAIPLVLCGAAQALAEPTAPDGIWYTKGQESIIKVAPCPDAADARCGTLVWLKEPNEVNGSPKLDTLNKDPAKKNKPMVGLEILVNMTAADDHWAGKAYNPEDGKFYEITFRVKTDKAANDEADLRGCILGFLCQTETFTRAKAIPGGGGVADAGHHRKHKGTKKDAASQ